MSRTSRRQWGSVLPILLSVPIIMAPGSASAASQQCELSGVLTNARVDLFESPSCSATPPLGNDSERLWLLPNAPIRRLAWSVTSAGDALPYALRCTQRLSIDGGELSPEVPIDMGAQPPVSAIGSAPVALRPYAEGATELDPSAWTRVVSSSRTGTAEFVIDCGEFGLARWTSPFSVIPESPAGREVGVSINDGAQYTNRPEVSLSLGWVFASRLKVSNDGGFAPSAAKAFDLTSADPISWRLVDLGNERLPKTVYVRFGSPWGGFETQTYTDDIILDTIKPQVLSALLSGSGAASLASGRMVRIRAKDNRSGLASIQVSAGKPKKKARVIKFRKAVAAPRSGRVFVRVRDGAGNWSAWRSAG